jgi:methyl coenzyme M reductase subunit C-like uncharacterized protein (methanogenesis marker protein 7)
LMKGNITRLPITLRRGRNIHIIKRIGETVVTVLDLELTIATGIKSWF